jgi:NADH dehydrogenase [ubiquinone] 1 alpha subcomplex assembly factor 5
MTSPAADRQDRIAVFDRSLLRRRRDRAAAGFAGYDFLYQEVAERLADRLDDVRRDFPHALDLGCGDGTLGRVLAGRKGIERLTGLELSPRLAAAVQNSNVAAAVAVGDEENLPFADGAFDLIVSNLALHWVNDLPGALIQARRALKPDGFFCAAMLGGETLTELRHALYEAEAEVCGGVSPRVSPFAEIRDAGGLMQRAGFALPVADRETITVTYADLFGLMRDLRGCGGANVVTDRRRVPAPRTLFLEAARRYADRRAEPDGRIPASFEVIFLAGWSPDPSQQQPLKPGQGEMFLGDALGKTCG